MTDEMKTFRVAVIGGGDRGRGVTNNLLRDANGGVEVAAVFDPDESQCQSCIEKWGSPNTRIAESPEAAIDTEGVEWVLVFSPNAFHKEHILAAFERGKHVFSEKPLATTIEDCVAVQEAHAASGLQFATGFVLRYAGLYKQVKQLLDSGDLGTVLSIDANENIAPSHGGYIMMNWRRHTNMSGPHILEKCCHDLDLLNWFTDSVPSRVSAFGGRDFFTPENQWMVEKYGIDTFASWPDPHRIDTPFTDDSDLMDNQVAIMEYRNGIRVQFQATMSNSIPERRMYFSCTEGTIIAELYTGTLRYKRFADEEETVVDILGDGHGGGDDFIMQELYDTMANGTPPKCSGQEGLLSAVTALAIDQAAVQGKVVDLEPTWKRLGH